MLREVADSQSADLHGLSVARTLDVPVAAHDQTDIAGCAEHVGPGALVALASSA